MRVAVVYPVQVGAQELHKAPGGFVRAARSLGHDAELIGMDATPDARAGGVRAAGPALIDVAWWREQKIDLALVVTHLFQVAVVEAAAAAGVRVIGLGDTDGLSVIRHHPIAEARRAWYANSHPLARAKNMKHFLHRCRHEDQLAEIARSLSACETTLINGRNPCEGVADSLRRAGRGQLASRLTAIPPIAAPEHLSGAVDQARDIDVIAVGRWDDEQKDPTLLMRSLRLLARRDPGRRVIAVGSLGTRTPPSVVEAPGHLPQEAVIGLLRRSRVLLFTSRWEGFPLAVGEGLCAGCRVVGPDIPAFRDVEEDGGGRIFRRRSARSVVEALTVELARPSDPVALASAWRERCDPARVLAPLIG